MPDCYLCGSYLARGEGYRRAVQFEASTSVYFSRHGGGSYRTRSGLRTLCGTCVDVEDRTRSWAWLRYTLYAVGCGVSIWAGCKLIANFGATYAGWFGVACLLCLPVVVLSNLCEYAWRKYVRDQVLPDEREQAASAFEYKVGYPKDEPSAERVSEPNLAPAESGLQHDAFRAGESVQTWAARVANELASITGADPASFRDTLLNLARYKKPKIGERVRDFNSRVLQWLGSLDRSLDVRSSASAIGPSERLSSWIERTAPLYLTIGEGECMDDVIPALARIAERTPPQPDESALAWVTRVEPFITAHNQV